LKPLFYLVSQEQEQEREQKWRTWVDERFVKVCALPHKHPLQWFVKPKPVLFVKPKPVLFVKPKPVLFVKPKPVLFVKPKPVLFRTGSDCQYLPQYV
jgi:hypothetical protein